MEPEAVCGSPGNHPSVKAIVQVLGRWFGLWCHVVDLVLANAPVG